MNRSLQVFVTCVVGAGIGTLVTLQLNLYFWWIGLIVGGVVGYLFYDPKQVLAAVKTAWHEVINYRFDKERTLDIIWGTLAVSSVLISCIWLVAVFRVMYLQIPEFSQSSEDENSFYVLLALMLAFYYCAFCVLVAILTLYDEDSDVPLATRRNNKRVCYRVNPITVSIYWPVRIIMTIAVFLWNYIPVAILATAKFIKTVFIAIHSQERLLCGVDAAIGLVIGSFFGNPVIGALVGGIIGILNFEIVSRRILHLSFEKN